MIVGSGVPLTLHMRETGSAGLTTFSLKAEMILGVPSAGRQIREASGTDREGSNLQVRLLHDWEVEVINTTKNTLVLLIKLDSNQN